MGIGSSIKDLFGDDVLGQIAEGAFGEDYLRDYTHASKLFRSGNMALMPRQKFLFHVFFTLNEPSMMDDVINGHDKGIIGAMVKSVQLPSFQLDTEELVQYNRKRLVHNRIKYNPVQMVLHDDHSDIVRSLWEKYYEYHFADSSYQYDEGIPGSTAGKHGRTNYNDRDLYDETRKQQNAGWGKTIKYGGTDGIKKSFFKDIKIFGLSQGRFASYTLINPVITSWQHDQYDYSQGNGLMQHTAEIQYEAVKYGEGDVKAILDTLAPESRYDRRPSALGTSASTFGQGGLTESFGSITDDLASGNIGGAIKTLGSSARSFGSIENLTNIVAGDLTGVATSSGLEALGEASKGALNFPSLASNNTSTSASPTKSGDND